MSRTFTYTFTVNNNTGTISVVTDDSAQTVTIDSNQYQGFVVTSASGTFDGETINGLIGLGGTHRTDSGDAEDYDNTIFVSNTQGAGGASLNGIDAYGLGLTTTTGAHYAIFQSSSTAYSYETGGNINPIAQPYATNYATTVCFYPGTLIQTAHGEVPVEQLVIGDVLLTADGDTRAVTWIGRQTVVAGLADPLRSFPIHIRADALGEGLPARDLRLSPDHALLIDGVLVQAGALVNGSTVTRVMSPKPVFTYYHVETQDHAIILAEGTPAETFVSNVTRRTFDNYAEYEALFGARADFEAMVERDEPRAMSARQVPPGIRARLAERAAVLGSREEVAA